MKTYQKIFIASLLLLIFIQVAVGMHPSIETDTLSISNTTLQNETVAVEPPECIPLYSPLDYSPSQGEKNVPVTADISMTFTRFSPSIMDYKITPEVPINVTGVRLEDPVTLFPGNVIFIFHPAFLLQRGTTYTVSITYGQYIAPLGSGGSCLNSTTSWQFITATGSVLRYAGPDGRLDKFEAVQAVQDYSSGAITRLEVMDVMIAYFSGVNIPP